MKYVCHKKGFCDVCKQGNPHQAVDPFVYLQRHCNSLEGYFRNFHGVLRIWRRLGRRVLAFQLRTEGSHMTWDPFSYNLILYFISHFNTNLKHQLEIKNKKTTFWDVSPITKTCLYNSDPPPPLRPNFYIVQLGFTGIRYFFYFCSKT